MKKINRNDEEKALADSFERGEWRSVKNVSREKQKLRDSASVRPSSNLLPMKVTEAITQAEAILPGTAAPDGEKDPRWQAIIAVGEFIEDEPEAVWAFVERWGLYPDEDLRTAIATCLLEHLLEHHFELIFPRVERLAHSNPCFVDVLDGCWLFGQVTLPENAARIRQLQANLKMPSAIPPSPNP